jgi:hypothetical protein
VSRRSYLLIIGERVALAWILGQSRMAFPPTRRAEVDRLAIGDELFLTTTRGCFHNPSRDRTRIIGRASVESEVLPLQQHIEIAGRRFAASCDIALHSLAPYRGGVELAPLVSDIECLRDSTAWGMRLRRPLLELSASDRVLVNQRLQQIALRAADALPDYLTRIEPLRR